ncbi:MAG: beta-ketoacyl-[acyl-carrier-protein] synthase family protein [Eggerthellaceae bacterium]|jgi:3-oxoacyl-[acyl-carrier-protein] synthase II
MVTSTEAPAQHRVVITGMGAITPAGIGVEALWNKLMAGVCCISPLPEELVADTGISVAGQIPDYDPLKLGFTKKEARRFSRFVQLAILASDEAMNQAGFTPEVLEGMDTARFACVFGSGIGSLSAFDREVTKANEKGSKRISPLFIPTLISNMAAGNLAIRYKLRGECTNIVTACATGTQNIGEAFRLIRFGFVDQALCGGTEEPIERMALGGFGNLGALTKEKDPLKASRPFDADRNGFVAGEGAGAMVLESLESAQARGAQIIAEITGYGATGDGYHMTAPEPTGEGATRAMRLALEEGGFTPDDLGHVNAHGTSTHANDEMESNALYALCGERAAEVPVTAVKGAIGHLLGGAGAVEAIVTARSVARGVVPPTVGHVKDDPKCPVRVSSEPVWDFPQKVALSNSFGFGGHNGSLAISPFRE